MRTFARSNRHHERTMSTAHEPTLTEAARLVAQGASHSEAARVAGVCRHKLRRYLNRTGGAAAAAQAVPESVDRNAPRRGRAGQRRSRADAIGIEHARQALQLHRDGVPYYEAAERMGVAISTYYEARARGMAAAREALATEADEIRTWATEQERQAHGRLLEDAAMARGQADLKAAVAAEREAGARRQRLAELWGANAPAKVEAKVDMGVDVLAAIGDQVRERAGRLAVVPNGATLGADDGDD